MIKENIILAYNTGKEFHKGVERKFSGLPYFSHVKYVARTLEQLGCNENLIIAGFLHDLIEDTEATYEFILEKFGNIVADLVMEVTSIKEDMIAMGGKRLYLANKICNMSDDALILKLADRFHNVLFLEHDDTPESFIKKYYKETKYILDELDESGRDFNEVQLALIKRIKAILEFLRIRYKYVNISKI